MTPFLCIKRRIVRQCANLQYHPPQADLQYRLWLAKKFLINARLMAEKNFANQARLHQ